MTNSGLNKLTEEYGEVLQIVGKLLSYPGGRHPDGKGELHDRLTAELGDAIAASTYVAEALGLNKELIEARASKKLKLYYRWAQEP